MRALLLSVLLLQPAAAFAEQLDKACVRRFQLTRGHTPADLLAPDLRLQAYELVLKADPGDARARYHRANLLAVLGRNAEATADYERVAKDDPEIIFTHYNLACLYALAGRKEDALAALELVLKKGYRHFDKIRGDSDLASLHGDTRLEALLQRYKAEPQLTPAAQYQLARTDGRAEMLGPDKSPTEAVLALARVDVDGQLRKLATAHVARSNGPDSERELLLALCDSNQGVGKLATGVLIARGPSVMPRARPLLDLAFPQPAFFVAQMAGRLRDRESTPQLRALLKADGEYTRFVAAEALGALDASEAADEIEALAKLASDDYSRVRFQGIAARLRRTPAGKKEEPSPEH